MDVEGQLLVPHWVRAYADLTAGHHFTEKLAAMEKTCLDYQLSEGKKQNKTPETRISLWDQGSVYKCFGQMEKRKQRLKKCLTWFS